MILNKIYEPMFSSKSHGFRPHLNCHTAVNQFKLSSKYVSFFIEGDTSKCFDSFNHNFLMSKLESKINDQVFLDLIRKGLKVGFIDLNPGSHSEQNLRTLQGSTLSLLLANIYLHEFDS